MYVHVDRNSENLVLEESIDEIFKPKFENSQMNKRRLENLTEEDNSFQFNRKTV